MIDALIIKAVPCLKRNNPTLNLIIKSILGLRTFLKSPMTISVLIHLTE